MIHLARGVPPLEAIPASELAARTKALVATRPDLAFQYPPLGAYRGDPELLEELGRLHDVAPERLFVGNGSLQVLDLLVAHLVDGGGGGDVLVEAPTYDRALQILARHGARVTAVPLEQDGLDVDVVARLAKVRRPRFLYTIPDFQNPSGVTLSDEKRLALISLAERHGFAIVEDVPYRELRYRGTSPPRLGELAEDSDANVVAVCSLSKVLSPGLRVGYAIGDAATANALAILAEDTYLSPNPLAQAVSARCVADGTVGANVERVRRLLKARHDAAVIVAVEAFGEGLLTVPQGGYFLAALVRSDVDEATLLDRARERGVLLTPGSAFYPSGELSPGTLFLRLPFQALEPIDFALGVERVLGALGASAGVSAGGRQLVGGGTSS